ncbi:MAG: hypothetical protein ACRD3Q_20160, partial [Terriglobales bacterium]
MAISATVELAQSEKDYLRENIEELAWPIAWQRVTGTRLDPYNFSRLSLATQIQRFEDPVKEEITKIGRDVEQALGSDAQTLGLEIMSDGRIKLVDNRPTEVAFQAYQPEHLGIIEYHSASRSYTRHEVAGINLDARQFADQRRQQTLYNWQAKYPSLDLDSLRNALNHERLKLESSLDDDTWATRFPGRDILRRFAEQHLNGIKYDVLANVILERMAANGIAPRGMKTVLD